MEIKFTIRVFKEGRMFVAYAPEFDVSSCGHSKEMAAENIKEAIRLFLETCEEKGTLAQVLTERRNQRYPLPDGRGSVSEITAVTREL
jgi:predicted RNase H-like HicB family nuclease